MLNDNIPPIVKVSGAIKTKEGQPNQGKQGSRNKWVKIVPRGKGEVLKDITTNSEQSTGMGKRKFQLRDDEEEKDEETKEHHNKKRITNVDDCSGISIEEEGTLLIQPPTGYEDVGAELSRSGKHLDNSPT